MRLAVVVIPVVIAIVIVVAVVVFVPPMVVIHAAVFPFPIAFIELAGFMARSHPMGSHVRRTAPIAFVPHVSTIYGVPVAVHPDVIWSRRCRMNPHDSGRRGRTDADADGNLPEHDSTCEQEGS